MKILISGGWGYLGARLGQFLATKPGYEILLGSRLTRESPSWLPQAKIVQTPWDDEDSLQRICGGVDAVVHLAGMNALECNDNPAEALISNALAPARLLDAACRQGVKRFIYFSTAHVYSSSLSGLISETTCPVSLHPYATSHRAGEDIVRNAHVRGAIEGVVIRLSNAFGPPVHRNVNCWMLLINDICRQAVMTRNIVLHSHGMQWRNFIPINIVTKAVYHFLNLPFERIGEGLFNLGGNSSKRVLEMAEVIAERCNRIFGFKPEIFRKKHNPNDCIPPWHYSVDRLVSTGFLPEGSCDEEIDATLMFCQQTFDKKG